MSAPRTNIEKQKRRHWWPLVGLALAVAFGAGMFLLWMVDLFEDAELPVNDQGELQETSPPGSEDVGAVDVAPTREADVPQSPPDAGGQDTGGEPDTAEGNGAMEATANGTDTTGGG